MKCFRGASVYVAGAGVTRADITFDEIIREIGTAPTDAETVALPEGAVVLPGFIDPHIHGAGGADAMDGTAAALATISETVAREGTTSFLATTMTESGEAILRALTAVRDCREAPGARLLGVHLEGPFISETYAGAQPREYIAAPDIDVFDRYQAASGGRIRIVTVAPEVPGADALIRHLAETGVVPSVGHSAAGVADVRRAIACGARSVTHTYNAQSPFRHREIGVAGSALLYDELNCELIGDGIHVSPEAIRLLVKNKPRGKMTLITDAMRAKGCPDGVSELGGQTVYVKNGEARLADGTLAGSVLRMNDAVRRMVQVIGLPLTDAVDMATKNTAALLGISDSCGEIACGKRADFTVLDPDFGVLLTVVGGREVYRR